MCWAEALSNKELAERLGRNPASVLHHVRTLVDTGFLAAEPERRGPRGAREGPYRAPGKSWRRDGAGAGAGSDVVLAAFLQEVAAAGHERLESTRLGLRLGPGELGGVRQRAQGPLR